MALVNTWIVTLRFRRGTYGTGLALVARLVPRPRWDAAAVCVAGVALCDIHLHFVWQAWHLSTHGSSLCVAGVALMALGWLWWRAWFPGRAGTPRRFAWQACHFVTSTFTLCSRRGTCQHMDRHFAWQAWHLWHWVGSGSSLCVAGVALMALGWPWWRAWFPGRAGTPRRFAWQAWHFVTSTFTLCGRRGACSAATTAPEIFRWIVSSVAC